MELYLEEDIKELEKQIIFALEMIYCYEDFPKKQFKEQILTEGATYTERIYDLLKHKNFIEEIKKSKKVKITNKGIEFLLECKKEIRTKRKDQGIYFLTIVIALTAISQAVADLNIISNWAIFGVLSLAIIIISILYEKGKLGY